MSNANKVSSRPPYNPPFPTSISVWVEGGFSVASPYIIGGGFTNDIDDEMDNVMILGDTSQNSGPWSSMQSFQQLNRAKFRLLETKL